MMECHVCVGCAHRGPLPGQPLRMPAPSKQRIDQLQQEHGQRSSVIVASGLEGFLSLSALLKPEVAAVFSAMVAGGSEGPLVVTGHGAAAAH